LEHVKDKLQLTIARLVANVQRREMTKEEKTLLLTEIAEATKWTPMEIANATGMSYTWIMKYLPDKYKDPEMHRRSELATQTKAVTQRVTEDIPTKEFKPKETWEHRKALMHPQHSKMEQKLRLKFQEHDLNPMVDYEFCIAKTIPDFYFVDLRLALYLDGPVHKNKEERDDYLREKLTERYGLRVASIPYKGTSDKELDRVFQKAMEVIRP